MELHPVSFASGKTEEKPARVSTKLLTNVQVNARHKDCILQSLPVVHGGLVLLRFSPGKYTYQSELISDAQFSVSFSCHAIIMYD